MSSLNSLAVAVEVASRKRDDARQALQDMLAAQQAARAQLDQLEDYARRRGMPIGNMRKFLAGNLESVS